MKKLGYVFLLLMCIVLAGCKGGNKVESIVDNPTAEIKVALGLDDVKNGKSINPTLDTTKQYYDIKVAENTASSLFYQEIDLNEYLGKRFHSVNLNILYFSGNLATQHVDTFIKEMNNETYGLNATKVGTIFKTEENISAELFNNLSIKKSIMLPENFESKDNDSAKLIVVYLPTYCIYNDGTQPVIRSFIMVPVYYAFTYESQVSSYVGSIKNYSVQLENGLLPSAK